MILKFEKKNEMCCPIPKLNHKSSPASYKLTSLPSTISKTLKKFVFNKIIQWHPEVSPNVFVWHVFHIYNTVNEALIITILIALTERLQIFHPNQTIFILTKQFLR